MFFSNATLNDSHQTQIVWYCAFTKVNVVAFYNHDKSICGYYEIQGEIVFSCGNQKIIHPMIKTFAFIILTQNLWVTTSKQHYDLIEIGLSRIYHEYF
jgi:hypothetical protein